MWLACALWSATRAAAPDELEEWRTLTSVVVATLARTVSDRDARGLEAAVDAIQGASPSWRRVAAARAAAHLMARAAKRRGHWPATRALPFTAAYADLEVALARDFLVAEHGDEGAAVFDAVSAAVSIATDDAQLGAVSP